MTAGSNLWMGAAKYQAMAQEFVLSDQGGVRWTIWSLEVKVQLYEFGSNESSISYFNGVLNQTRHGRR